MNLDFNFYNPTKIFFGKESMKYLSEELENYGPNILLVYGKSSIKKSGLYDDIISVLKKCGKNVTELSGSGICGIAVISAIFAQKDIVSATKDLKEQTLRMLENK